MKKPKEQFEWVDITSVEARGLADNAPELLRLLDTVPEDSPLYTFLFPTLKLREKKTTTKSRFLALCRALAKKKSPLGLYSRVDKIHKAFHAPANPKRFHRFVETFKAHASQSLLYPIALDLKSKANSLRSSQYLGHPGLNAEAWLALGNTGRELSLNFSNNSPLHSYTDGVPSQMIDGAIQGGCTTPANKLYLRLKKQALQDGKPLHEQTPQFLAALDHAISVFPNVRELDSYTALQLAHVLDSLPGTCNSGSNSAHQHNFFFFTDGARLMIKIGVYCPGKVAHAVPPNYYQGRAHSRLHHIPKDVTSEDKIFYALLDLATLTPHVFDFDNFIPVGDSLPKTGDKYFTVATFNFRSENEHPVRDITGAQVCDRVNSCVSTYQGYRDASQFIHWASRSLSDAFLIPFAVNTNELFCNQINNSPHLTTFKHYQRQHRAASAVIEPETLGWSVEEHITNNNRSRLYSHPSEDDSSTQDMEEDETDAWTPFMESHCPCFDLSHVFSVSPSSAGVIASTSRGFFTTAPKAEDATTRIPFDPTGNRSPASMPQHPFAPLFTSNIDPNTEAAYAQYYGQDQLEILRKKGYGPLFLADSVVSMSLYLPLTALLRETYDKAFPGLQRFAFFVTLPCVTVPAPPKAKFMPAFTALSAGPRIMNSDDMLYTRRRAPRAVIGFPEPSTAQMFSALAKEEDRKPLPFLPAFACVSTVSKDFGAQSFSCALSYRVSPLTISEGTIHVSPSINSLNTLSKWGKILRAISRDIQEREQSLVSAAKEEATFFTPRTLASRYRGLTKANEPTEPQTTGESNASN